METQVPNGVDGSVDGIVGKLVEMLRSKTKEAGEDWSATTTLTEAGIDSFDVVEYIFEIEDAFGIDIDFNANTSSGKLETVGDFAKLIHDKLQPKVAAA